MKTLAHCIRAAYMIFLVVALIFGRRVCVYVLTADGLYCGASVLRGVSKRPDKPFGGPYFDLTFNADGRILLNFAAGLMVLFIHDLFYYGTTAFSMSA